MALSVMVVGASTGAPVAHAADSTTEPPTTSDAPTTTTGPPSSPSPTTDVPEPTTSVPAPTTTAPAPAAAPSVIDPSGEGTGLSPDQALATQQSFHALTQSDRALLTQLQTTRDALAVRRFALVALASEVAGAKSSLDAAQARANAATTKVNRMATRINGIKQEIVWFAGAAYRTDAAPLALGAINTTDASALARAERYAYANASVLYARLAKLETLQQHLESARADAESARSAAEADDHDLTSRLVAQAQAAAAAGSAASAAQLAVVNALGSGVALLAQVADPHFGADMITAALAITQTGEEPPALVIAMFQLPTPGAPLGSPYGMRIDPLTGNGGYHPGVDFEAAAGTPIHAAAAGTVVMAGDCGGYGNCVVIDHGNALATVYAHQSMLLSRVGEHVVGGQVIGLVGSTGMSTGPHLHFEVRIHGAPVDPVPTLTGA